MSEEIPPTDPEGATVKLDVSQTPTVVPASSSVRSGSRPSAGQKFGDYLILRELGEGGMGQVFEAQQLENGRRVALKVIHEALADESERARFLREGRLAASVSHPNSVYVYCAEEINGMPAIAMELLPGGTLRDQVKSGGPLGISEALNATFQMISGLEAAASIGVLHRDIKPGNCFVAADG